jgi:hypothetical protein
MSQTKPIQNLLVLEQAREMAKETFLQKYNEVVSPYIHIIKQVEKANNENHFEAMKRIQVKRLRI